MALEDFDLPTVFACAVELGRVLAPGSEAPEADSTDLLFDRLTKALRMDEGGTTSDILRRFRFAACSPAARNALKRLVFALAGLNGEPECVQAGRTLLEHGTWQLWEGMVETERGKVKHLLPVAAEVWLWPRAKRGKPAPFPGPREFVGHGWVISNGRAQHCPPAHGAGTEQSVAKDARKDTHKKMKQSWPLDPPKFFRLARAILKRMQQGKNKQQAVLEYANGDRKACWKYLQQLTRYRKAALGTLGSEVEVLYPRVSKRQRKDSVSNLPTSVV